MRFTTSSLFFTLAAAQTGYINYTTVTGYFLQDQASTNTTGFDYTAVNFGLINQTYSGVSSSGLTQWQQFKQVVDSLNANSALDTVYKVLFLGRHGEGYHNAAETYYGTPAWNCYWSILNGNGTAVWADADLTPNGVNQALIANAFWKREIANQKIPYPQSYYTSPLTRCLRTANLTFSDIPTPEYYPFIPEVKEFFREGISEHTCDRRSNKTYIHNRFPTYTFEPGFTETDELWHANLAETSNAQDARSKSALDSVFNKDDHTWVSVTSHSGEIASLLRVLGHRSFSLSTGAVIPVLVKAQFLSSGPSPTISGPASTFSAYCTNSPPITSIASAAQGCVCSGTASSGLVSRSVPGSASNSSGKPSSNTASRSASTSSSHATTTAASSSRATSSTNSTSSVHASSSVHAASVTASASKSKVRACKSKASSTHSTSSVHASSSVHAASVTASASKSKVRACKSKAPKYDD